MNTFTHVPPGFRFHPTDEELVDYYLRRKVNSKRIDLDIIKDVDLYKIEPWDLQELCRIGAEEQNDWYFFSHKDKKYPTGTRTNRATTAGFWKATGRDKAIYSKQDLVGMRKTLVFYQGRAPNGHKSDWIMHEYRLENDENGAPQEEGWVVCRVFKKRITTTQQRFTEPDSPSLFDEHVTYVQDRQHPNYVNFPRHNYPNYNDSRQQAQFLQLPLLESPRMIQARNIIGSYGPGLNVNPGSNLQSYSQNIHVQNFQSPLMLTNVENGESCGDQVTTDWRVLDKLVASQLSHDEDSDRSMNIQEMVQENNANMSSDIWK